MKRNVIYTLLAVEAALCVCFCIVREALAGAFSSVLAFPFEQIALGLRALSLTGAVGNTAAVILYVLVSLAPVGYMVFASSRRKLAAEDALLALCSALLLAALYLMVNPAELAKLTALGSASLPAARALLGLVIWSVLAGYVILRLLRLFSQSGTESLLRYLTVFMWILAAVFTLCAFGSCFGELLTSISSMRAANVGNEGALGMSYVFLVLGFLVNALPWVLDVVTVVFAVSLLEAMTSDRYSPEAVERAEKLSRWCVRALAAAVLSGVGYNVLQLVFYKLLMTTNTSVSIPVTSVCFVLAALIFSKVISEGRGLKADNDLFI